MKTHSFEFIADRGFDVASVFAKQLDGFVHIAGNNAHTFVAERTSLRTNAATMSLVVVSHDGNGRFRVDLVAGGGTVGVLMPLGFGAESCELRDLMESLKSVCRKEGIHAVPPGEDYYNT